MKIVLGIATAGRRDQMRLTLGQIALQEEMPAEVIICPADPADLDVLDTKQLACPVAVVFGKRGLCAQRNLILDACAGADAIIFIDDDYYPAPDYILQLRSLLSSQIDIVIATNQPVADGASGPGIAHVEALRILDSLPSRALDKETLPTYGGYGCNFAIRLDVVRRESLRFDEKLPLYGWLEDIDFSRRASVHGRVVNHHALRGVHLGTKKGRTSGVRFGYSQIANPLYMVKKGSMSKKYAWNHIIKHALKNMVRSLNPEPWVDRRGRLKGNLLAWMDLFAGRLRPERILDLQ